MTKDEHPKAKPVWPTSRINGHEVKPFDSVKFEKRLGCDVHDWPDDEWPRRFAEHARRRVPLEACPVCLRKWFAMAPDRIARERLGKEFKRHGVTQEDIDATGRIRRERAGD